MDEGKRGIGSDIVYDIEQKKAIIIEAGIKLLETGLIARTWGNVSYRIDASTFLITPSGRDYHTITPDEIVTVAIDDLSYEGLVKPSSEKGVHAHVYAQFPDINFVIHTHQLNASAISTTGLPYLPIEKDFPLLSNKVPIANYALPGTKKLMENVEKSLKLSSSHAIIMQNHGAVCFGRDFSEAFETAEALEIASQSFLFSTYKAKGGHRDVDDIKLCHYALSSYYGHPPKYEEPKLGTQQSVNTRSLYPSNQITFVDKKYRILLQTPEVIALSVYGIALKPMLDDFAQIAGRNVVLLKGEGAYCYGKSLYEAEAVALVTQKNAKAMIASALLGQVKPINPLESLLMRIVYKTKYSKQNNKEAL